MDAQVFQTLERIAAEQDPAKKARLKEQSEDALARHFSNSANISDLRNCRSTSSTSRGRTR
jgi:hypothetical protein